MRDGRSLEPVGAATRMLSGIDVETLLTPHACIVAVKDALRRHALGETRPPGIVGMHGGAAVRRRDRRLRFHRTGLQDVAAPIATYRQALAAHAGTSFTFS